LDQVDATTYRVRFGAQALLGLGQHRRRRIENCHIETKAGERQ